MRTSIVPSLLAAAGIGLAGLAGCGSRSDSAETAARPVVAVRAAALAVRSFADSIAAPGQWRSSGEVVIAAPFAGTIDSVLVRVGDRVPAGRVVCWLVTRESRAALRGAELLEREAKDDAARAEAARALALARRDLVRVPLPAPRAGVVIRRSLEPGVEAAESAEIAALVPDDAIVFEARVAPADAVRLRTGQRAVVLAPGAAARPGTVQRTLPTAGAADQTTLAWIAPDRGAPPPEIDRFGTATIFVGPTRRALAVPDSAVVEDDLTGRRRVAVITDAGIAVWTGIELGIGSGGWHEIRAPTLSPGVRVVVQGQRGLPDSTQVKLAS